MTRHLPVRTPRAVHEDERLFAVPRASGDRDAPAGAVGMLPVAGLLTDGRAAVTLRDVTSPASTTGARGALRIGAGPPLRPGSITADTATDGAALRAVLRRSAPSGTRADGIPAGHPTAPEPIGVRVHYNSPEPARLHARAFTRGSDVHLGPGQERHLPHELQHVVQQRQGRVRPDGALNGVPVSLDPHLECEAAAGVGRSVPEHPGGGAPRAGAADVAQLLIIGPPVESLDTVITIAIYQQLVSGVDDRVGTFNMFSSGKLDLTKERAVHIQGHGSKLGVFESVADGLEIGRLLTGRVPDDIMICLDYCYSHAAMIDVKKSLPKAQVFASKNASITQNTGEALSRSDPVPLAQADVMEERGLLANYIVASDYWKNALAFTGALRSDLAALQKNGQENVQSVTQLFLDYGELIWQDVGGLYGFFYEYNEILKDVGARTQM